MDLLKNRQITINALGSLLVAVVLIVVALSTKTAVVKNDGQKTAKKEETPTDRIGKANGLYKKGNFKGAIKIYKNVVNEKPKDPEIRYLLGNAYQGSGNLDKAAQEYKQATELRPQMIQALYQLGLVYKAQGQNYAAYEALNKCVEKAPDLGGARVALAKMYTQDNKIDKAVEQYNALLELKLHGMNLADIHNELGLLYVKKGDVERAKSEWHTSLTIDPDDQRAKDLLGQY